MSKKPASEPLNAKINKWRIWATDPPPPLGCVDIARQGWKSALTRLDVRSLNGMDKKGLYWRESQ